MTTTSDLPEASSTATPPVAGGNQATTSSCPVCGSHDFRVVHSDARDPITLDGFHVTECSGCGIAYTTPRPAAMGRYYPSLYRAYGPLVSRVLRALYEARVSRWTRLGTKGSSVLEIGCGPGLMLEAFSRRGWSVSGIERNAAAAAAARRLAGARAVFVSIEELPPGARFDLIVMFQVLEHIGEPVDLLRKCAQRLAPGGRLIVNVPNFASWQSRLAGSKWMHLDVPRHLVHFRPESLARTLKRAGLEAEKLSFVSWEHDPYGWVESTISRVGGRHNTLTRFLMGLDSFGPRVLLACLAGALLLVPALLLATASWLTGNGALMEIIAVNSTVPQDRAGRNPGVRQAGDGAAES